MGRQTTQANITISKVIKPLGNENYNKCHQLMTYLWGGASNSRLLHTYAKIRYFTRREIAISVCLH